MAGEVSPYPGAFGTEFEVGVVFDVAGKGKGLELTDFPNYFEETAGTAQEAERFVNQFDKHGFRLYLDQTVSEYDRGIIEIASPETATLDDATLYANASTLVSRQAIEHFLIMHNIKAAEIPGIPEIERVRMQQRVRDFHGNAKGVHDNYDLSQHRSNYRDNSSFDFLAPIAIHALTRSFITGAGYVSPRGFEFSQKNSGVKTFDGERGLPESIYTRKDNSIDGNSLRLEIRNNDANISEWATWMRIGSMALVMGMVHTPALKKKLRGIVEPYLNGYSTPEIFARRCNSMEISAAMEAADIQHQFAELAFDMQIYSDLPDEYFQVATEWMKFIEDFKAAYVADLHPDFSELADRADWAKKYGYILSKVGDRRLILGGERTTDYRAAKYDLLYDIQTFVPVGDAVVNQLNGYGHQAASTGEFRRHIKPSEILRATVTAPDTRAALRGGIIDALLQCGLSVDPSWTQIEAFAPNSLAVGVMMLPADPLATELSEREEAKLREILDAQMAGNGLRQ